MQSRIKDALRVCVKTTIKRTSDFRTFMPCDEIQSILRKGFTTEDAADPDDVVLGK